MREFWVSSGHLLLDRQPSGGLVVTDAFLRAYLARPELMPPPDACEAERGLHARLLEAPRRSVSAAAIAAIADADARENWDRMLGFRDRLLAAPTLQAAYARMVRQGVGAIPPLFLGHLAHLIMRSALDGSTDAYVARAAELFYRPQKANLAEGRVLLADAEIIARHEHDRHASPLLAMLGGAAITELDVLSQANHDQYWGRSDAHDMVLDLGGKPGGRFALATALELWIGHIHGFDATIEPIDAIDDDAWRWFVGLDAEATRIGNALWSGAPVSEDRLGRVLALFRLTLAASVPVVPRAAGKPVYLILAMGEDGIVRLKPQNLVTGLPVEALATAN
jgi:hypothetical protein